MNVENRMDDIINRMKKRRKELMLSYQDLADKTGLNKSTLQRYETGAIKNMPLDKLEVLAAALEVEPSYLMGWDLKDDTENSTNTLNESEKLLLENFNKLNNPGKEKLLDYSSDLTETPKYLETSRKIVQINNDIPEEDYTFAAHDDDLDPETAKRNIAKAKAIFKQMDEEN